MISRKYLRSSQYIIREQENPLQKINLLLWLREPFTAVGGNQHLVFEANIAVFSHDAEFEGEDDALFDRMVGCFAVARPAGTEQGSSVVRVSANTVAQRVLVFGITGFNQK